MPAGLGQTGHGFQIKIEFAYRDIDNVGDDMKRVRARLPFFQNLDNFIRAAQFDVVLRLVRIAGAVFFKRCAGFVSDQNIQQVAFGIAVIGMDAAVEGFGFNHLVKNMADGPEPIFR